MAGWEDVAVVVGSGGVVVVVTADVAGWEDVASVDPPQEASIRARIPAAAHPLVLRMAASSSPDRETVPGANPRTVRPLGPGGTGASFREENACQPSADSTRPGHHQFVYPGFNSTKIQR